MAVPPDGSSDPSRQQPARRRELRHRLRRLPAVVVEAGPERPPADAETCADGARQPCGVGAILKSEGLPATALVSSHNEAHLLGRCLDSVAFCDEVIVIDIDSHDDTADVARAHGARVIEHVWVPIAERARLELLDEAQHDWLLFLDPDEILSPALAAQLTALVPALPPTVAVVDCPWQFYFRGKPLRGTFWGGVNRKRTLTRRGAAELRPTVHSG